MATEQHIRSKDDLAQQCH